MMEKLWKNISRWKYRVQENQPHLAAMIDYRNENSAGILLRLKIRGICTQA